MVKPPDPPTGPPDLASPGFWCVIVDGASQKQGFIQVALNTSPDHVPTPPTTGLPGEYMDVYAGQFGPRTAWVPTPAK
jgi:hypothetical protein